MGGPFQILAKTLLSQHRVSSSRINNPWYPLGAGCNGRFGITRAAVWLNEPHSRIDVGASPHLYMYDWNLPTPLRRRLSRSQAGLNKSMPNGLALSLGSKKRVVD